MTSKKPLAALLMILLAAQLGLAQAQATPVGMWKICDPVSGLERLLVRITEEDGVLSGNVEKILDPAIEPGAVCQKCSGQRKDQRLLGLNLIAGVKPSLDAAGTWDGGQILDPNSGKTYSVRLIPASGGKTLAVRGYIGTPMMGRTQTWLRVD